MQRYGCSQPTVQQAEVLGVITILELWPGLDQKKYYFVKLNTVLPASAAELSTCSELNVDD